MNSKVNLEIEVHLNTVFISECLFRVPEKWTMRLGGLWHEQSGHIEQRVIHAERCASVAVRQQNWLIQRCEIDEDKKI